MHNLRIAHMSLPFYNGGGLVKYVQNLVNEQSKDSRFEYTCIFVPGYYSFFNKKVFITKKKLKNIDIFNINNFNPDTLLEGTKYPLRSIENTELEDTILEELVKLRIDIVHFHTFFGLSSNLIEKIKQNNIRVIYTAHDHQPLCTKTTLLDSSNQLCTNKNITNCNLCNANALNKKGLMLRYSNISNSIKKFDNIKSKIKLLTIKYQKNSSKNNIANFNNQDYIERRNSFIQNLNNNCDLIIFSSELTYKIYKSFGLISDNFKIIPISNLNITNDICDYELNFKYKKYTFGYLGGDRNEKGYHHMINSFEKLKKEGINDWKLIIYGKGSENIIFSEIISENIIVKGYSDTNLYDEFDILLVPSICPETFNFVVLEGLSNKKLIIASDIVGSADLYKQNGIITYKHNNEYDLMSKLKNLNNQKKYKININCNNYSKNLKFSNHYNEIYSLYTAILY